MTDSKAMVERLPAEVLSGRLRNLMTGCKKLYDGPGPNHADMWFFELFHHLDEAATLIEEQQREIERSSDHVQKLQAALSFWMPGVSEAIEIELNGRAGNDAMLLYGFGGESEAECWGDKILARALAAESQVTALKHDIERHLGIIESNCWDLRCVDIPTGAGDADIGWQVIEHNMAPPKERIVGFGNSPLEALNDAMAFLAPPPRTESAGCDSGKTEESKDSPSTLNTRTE